MARSVRRKSHESDEEEDEDSPRQSMIKRVKREHLLDEEDGAEGGAAAGRTSRASSSEATVECGDDLDNADKYESIAEEDLIAAFEKTRKELNGQIGTAAEAGIIKSVTLVDFMCHRHLTMDMASRINFVVGHNGSGKSAVLTAIIVALGGRSNVTGRGTGVKEFIRQGADRAVITLTLRNSGPMAFKPEDYPEQIVIERTIERSGASSYKIRATRDGRIVARKKQEMNEIVTHFNISVDSPATVLTQDEARSFLTNHDDSKLYDFFLNCTDLSTLEKAYVATIDRIEMIESHVDNSRESVPDLMERQKDMQQKIDSATQADRLKTKLQTLRHELAWAFVATKEQDDIAKLNDDIAAKDTDVREAAAERRPLETTIKRLKVSVTETRNLLAVSEGSEKDEQDRIDRARREIQRYDKEIADLRLKADAGLGDEQRTLLRDKESHQERLDSFLRQRPMSEETVRQRTSAQQQAKDEEDLLGSQYSESASHSSALQNKVNSLKGQKTDRVGLFGTGIHRVLQEIDRAHWTGPKPLGPLGQYIHLLDERYGPVIHSIMGDAMCGFSVRNARDRAQLLEILKRAQSSFGYRIITGPNGRQNKQPLPPLITFGGDIFDFSAGDCHHMGETVLSKLRFDNEEVLRIFINLSSIERTFVAPEVMSANNMLDHLCSPTLRSVNIFSADNFRSSGTYNGDGIDIGRQSGPVTIWRQNNLFTKDLAAQLRADEAELEQSRAETENRRREHQAAIERRKQADEELKKARLALEKVQRAIPAFEQKLEEIDGQLKYQPSDEIDAKEEGRKNAYKDVESAERYIHGIQEEQEGYKADLREYEAELGRAEEQVEELAPRSDRLRDELSRMTQNRAKSQGIKQHYESMVQSHGDKRQKLEEAVAHLQMELGEWETKANAMTSGVRVASRRDAVQLQASVNATEKAIRTATLTLGFDLDLVKAQKAELDEQIKVVTADIKTCADVARKMRSSMNRRRSWWVNCRSSTAVRTKTLFTMNMRKRGIEGSLDFDHTNGKLSTKHHNPTKGDDPSLPNSKTAKQMSGGEKSFTTVSLLLALWDSASGPIRCLDEWDVFLDHVNRTTAGNMLIAGAKESVETQYILITPQDMGGIRVDGADNKTHRMSDPDRRQSTLPYSAAAA